MHLGKLLRQSEEINNVIFLQFIAVPLKLDVVTHDVKNDTEN